MAVLFFVGVVVFKSCDHMVTGKQKVAEGLNFRVGIQDITLAKFDINFFAAVPLIIGAYR